MDLEAILKIIFLLLLAVLPSLIWLAFFIRRDRRPEPKKFLILTFLLGGLFTIIGIFAENNWFSSFVQNNPSSFIGSFLFLTFYPFLEEILKFLAARVSIIKNKHFLDEKSDPMVYMITAALGFAAAENLRIFFLVILDGNGGTILNLSSLDLSQSLVASLAITALVRFLATVLLHALSSAILGYFWAMLRLTSQKIKMALVALPLGVILATSVHALFNYLIVNSVRSPIVLIFLLVFLAIAVWAVKGCFRKLNRR